MIFWLKSYRFPRLYRRGAPAKLESDFIQDKYFKNQSGSAIQNVASVATLKTMKIPLPPLEIQKQLVAEAEKEEEIITANRRLIELMEGKISQVLSEI